MSWNIEVMCIRDRDLAVGSAVPDVFGPTEDRFGFEDATSVMRGDELCAARIGDWVVVIDTGCRLSGFESYLDEISAGRDVYVFRVSSTPLHLHYRDGTKQVERRGIRGCLAELTGRPRDKKDGELIAQDLLHEKTQLGFMTELWRAKYQAFALD
ncbi:Hypothetical protein A7982_06139 [Minicystis rosea]|nr:Hypothetical protein A7982_06139 [Minicystis rosea]